MAPLRMCLQCFLIILNIICLVVGVLGLILTIIDLDTDAYGTKDSYENILQIFIGSFLIIVSLIGAFAIVNRSVKLLILLIIIQLLLMLLHIWKVRRFDEQAVRSKIKLRMIYTWIEGLADGQQQMAIAEAKYDCCGVHNSSDYSGLKLQVPSRCEQKHMNEYETTAVSYKEGCLNSILRLYLKMYRWEKWSHISLIVIELLNVVLTVALIWNLTANTLRYNY